MDQAFYKYKKFSIDYIVIYSLLFILFLSALNIIESIIIILNFNGFNYSFEELFLSIIINNDNLSSIIKILLFDNLFNSFFVISLSASLVCTIFILVYSYIFQKFFSINNILYFFQVLKIKPNLYLTSMQMSLVLFLFGIIIFLFLNLFLFPLIFLGSSGYKTYYLRGLQANHLLSNKGSMNDDRILFRLDVLKPVTNIENAIKNITCMNNMINYLRYLNNNENKPKIKIAKSKYYIEIKKLKEMEKKLDLDRQYMTNTEYSSKRTKLHKKISELEEELKTKESKIYNYIRSDLANQIQAFETELSQIENTKFSIDNQSKFKILSTNYNAEIQKFYIILKVYTNKYGIDIGFFLPFPKTLAKDFAVNKLTSYTAFILFQVNLQKKEIVPIQITFNDKKNNEFLSEIESIKYNVYKNYETELYFVYFLILCLCIFVFFQLKKEFLLLIIIYVCIFLFVFMGSIGKYAFECYLPVSSIPDKFSLLIITTKYIHSFSYLKNPLQAFFLGGIGAIILPFTLLIDIVLLILMIGGAIILAYPKFAKIEKFVPKIGQNWPIFKNNPLILLCLKN